MTYQMTTLQNGLRVASEWLPGVESVAVSISVGVGSRYENEREGGISHLLEHMAFKGTKTRSALAIAEAFDNIGGQFNAYTSAEHTVYYAKVLKHELPLAVDILADIMLNSVFDAEELKREQGVVLQEIAMQQDTPDDLIYDFYDVVAWPDQPMGRSILGKPQQISAYTRDDLMNYMASHYAPGRMVLSAAGNLSHEQFAAIAEQHCRFAPNIKPAVPEPGRYGGGDVRVAQDLEQLHLVLGFPGLSVHDEHYYALQLYSSILGGGMSSRLFQEVREKRGLAYHVSSSSAAYSDCGSLSIYSATGEKESAELPLLLTDELKKIADNVTDAELARVKNQHKAELLMARENPGTVAGWMGKHLLIFNRYRELSEIIARIDAVSREDIKRMGERVLATEKPTLAALGPIGKLPDYDAIKARLKR